VVEMFLMNYKKRGDIIEKITHIFVSHDDDDHMGSLKTLLFYRYYVLGLRTTIILPHSKSGKFHQLMRDWLYTVNLGFSDSKLKYVDVIDLIYIPANVDEVGKNDNLITFKGIHHTESYGLIVIDNDKLLFISGDTRAVKESEELVDKRIAICHDWSNWDNVSANTHCCETDFNKTYKSTFKKYNVRKYHNNKDFRPEVEFQKVDILKD
jgi:ribonuclease BN (tRNA processing enzyme)